MLDSHAQASGIDQAANLGKLFPAGKQPPSMARPDNHASRSSMFNRVIADVNWYQPTATFEGREQMITPLAADCIKDEINVVNNLFYRCGGIIDKFINAQFAQKCRIASRRHTNDPCPFELCQLDREVTNVGQRWAAERQTKTGAEMMATPITERANAHRGTFYAHFSDKYELANYP